MKNFSRVQAVIQEERTGCAIACVAALAGVSYATARKEAAGLGISAADPALWSATGHVRRLLAHFGLRAGRGEKRFTAWDRLPDCALLAIKWHREPTGPAWHWVVFTRDGANACVLDSKRALRTHRRTDFGRMKPKWFIAIDTARHRSPA
ncbi:MAG TPA: hypothetical protein VG838_09595 [Opitutaceae bacterium]|nr:hypothetical protein [Opitutaceae bacterium]